MDYSNQEYHNDNFTVENLKSDKNYVYEAKLYNKIYKKCIENIKYENRKGKSSCYFSIPRVIMGEILYNPASCTVFLIKKFRKIGFKVTLIRKFIILLSWLSANKRNITLEEDCKFLEEEIKNNKQEEINGKSNKDIISNNNDLNNNDINNNDINNNNINNNNNYKDTKIKEGINKGMNIFTNNYIPIVEYEEKIKDKEIIKNNQVGHNSHSNHIGQQNQHIDLTKPLIKKKASYNDQTKNMIIKPNISANTHIIAGNNNNDNGIEQKTKINKGVIFPKLRRGNTFINH